jgi:plasmid stability protein
MARLRERAAAHGRSVEAEARAILEETLRTGGGAGRLGSRIQKRFAGLRGEELDLPARSDPPRAADLRR